MSDSPVLTALRDWLTSQGVAYREVRHEPTTTSEQSAQARGEELRVGGKALLMKGDDDQFRLFVLPANRKVDSAALRQKFGFKRLRFATAEGLKAATELVPGSVPPFGRPILPFDLYLDSAVKSNDRIAFNAGALTDSMIVPMVDYLRVAQPADCFPFSVEPEA